MNRTLLISLLICLAGCREELDMVPGKTLEALLVSDRKIAFSRFHVTGSGVLRADGRFSIVVPRLGEDQGRWWLEGDRICSRWDRFRKGQDLCAAIGRLPDGSYRSLFPDTGAHMADFTVQE